MGPHQPAAGARYVPILEGFQIELGGRNVRRPKKLPGDLLKTWVFFTRGMPWRLRDGCRETMAAAKLGTGTSVKNSDWHFLSGRARSTASQPRRPAPGVAGCLAADSGEGPSWQSPLGRGRSGHAGWKNRLRLDLYPKNRLRLEFNSPTRFSRLDFRASRGARPAIFPRRPCRDPLCRRLLAGQARAPEINDSTQKIDSGSIFAIFAEKNDSDSIFAALYWKGSKPSWVAQVSRNGLGGLGGAGGAGVAIRPAPGRGRRRGFARCG